MNAPWTHPIGGAVKDSHEAAIQDPLAMLLSTMLIVTLLMVTH